MLDLGAVGRLARGWEAEEGLAEMMAETDRSVGSEDGLCRPTEPDLVPLVASVAALEKLEHRLVHEATQSGPLRTL